MSLGVGIIGAGVVGGGVIRTLLANRELIRSRTGVDVILRHVADLDTSRLAEFDLSGVTVSQDALALIQDPNVQVVCELIGGLKPAKSLIHPGSG